MIRWIPVVLTVVILFVIAIFLTFSEERRKTEFQQGSNLLMGGDKDAASREWRPSEQQVNTCYQVDLNVVRVKDHDIPRYNDTAMKWYRLVSKLGNAKTHYRLGDMYAYGEGVIQNHGLATKLYQLARTQGDEDSDIDHDVLETERFTVGLDCYQNGEFELAFGEWEILARHGFSFNNVRSQCRLGEMYKNGQGVNQDLVFAYMWFEIAASQGMKEAADNRNLVAKQMTLSQLKSATNLALQFTPKQISLEGDCGS